MNLTGNYAYRGSSLASTPASNGDLTYPPHWNSARVSV